MTKINVLESPKLRNPLLIEGLPGVGNIGRVAVGYMIKELGAKKFADLYSEHFFPFVMLQEGYNIRLLKNEFYYYKAKGAGQRDLILLIGDCQSLSPHGHYEVADAILEFAQKLGVREVFTIGGLATGELEKRAGVLGAATSEKVKDRYAKFGVNFNAGDKVGYIVGAAGLIPGLSKERGMDGLCILGETTGFPIVTDPKAAEAVLNVLTKIIKIKINMARLDSSVKEMEGFIKKVEALQKKAIEDIQKHERAPVEGKEQLRYIG
ncbi:MAG: proteasome assembly chaperone family protein [Candidatus Aenigmarchaeota archaeon]|nr:proteasome assembly chaperone family protein [Candidatus Aenigmarchaeota archaeon]